MSGCSCFAARQHEADLMAADVAADFVLVGGVTIVIADK
jgi:hypothetical protein